MFLEELLYKKKYLSSWNTQSIHGLTREFGEDNLKFVNVVIKKESHYHYLIPASNSFTGGIIYRTVGYRITMTLPILRQNHRLLQKIEDILSFCFI